MYDLVNDIEAYPRFLPACTGAQVLARSDDELSARVELSKGGIHKAFTTRNKLQQNTCIEMELVDGPFRHLEGAWRFEALAEDACKVSLDLEFEFSNRLLSMSVGPIFSSFTGALVDAFVRRAHAVYGKD